MSDDWLAKLKETMAVDLSRFIDEGMSPRMVVERLMDIPEVGQAFHLRANQRQALPIDPSTVQQKQEVAEALERAATWLDDGFHEEIVAELREIAGDLQP